MTSSPDRHVLTGDHLRAATFPLGGIGTGTISLAGDGSLRRWQIHNQINHLACVPHSFFAVWSQRKHHPGSTVARVLQTDAFHTMPDDDIPWTTSDHVVPDAQKQLLGTLPGVQRTSMSGDYPIVEMGYEDEALPLDVSLEAFNPMAPLDSDLSGSPTILFNLTVSNPQGHRLRGAVMATLQNSVGWNGLEPITGNRYPCYGGNTNALVQAGGGTTISMTNGWLPPDHELNGSLALAIDGQDGVTWATQWDNLDAVWADFSHDGRLACTSDSMPSNRGETWNSAIAVRFDLEPGESRTIPITYAWHFPNRMVNWDQTVFFKFHDEHSRFWIGNHYATRFQSAIDVSNYVRDNRDSLTAVTRQTRDTLRDTTLPRSMRESYTSQISVARSATCFHTADDRFFGFEGCNGASTGHHTDGTRGSCPLNCTHVWNYEMTIARLWPDLERTMRETEWHIQQAPDGSLPHRVLMPTYLPRNHGQPIGGPTKPALDGLFGAILKTLREYRMSGDREWLAAQWPGVKRAIEHVWRELDPDRRGVIEGEQPNTYDISIFGLNTFIGTLYLAALEATAVMADVQGDDDLAVTCRDIATRGGAELDARLWNSAYYIQDVDLAKHPEQNWATGCHMDQLLGQWWADALGLGDLLEPEHLRIATKSIFTTNFRDPMSSHEPVGFFRQYVAPDDAGTVICTWPHGGRPEVPTLYSDEVWTGLEYELAALLIAHGHVEDAQRVTDAIRDRHDGRRQSPWNDIECGDYYVRAMSSWSILERASGFDYDAAAGRLTFDPKVNPHRFRAPFVTRDGWGTYAQTITNGQIDVAVSLVAGHLDIDALEIAQMVSDGPVSLSLAAGETWTTSGQARTDRA